MTSDELVSYVVAGLMGILFAISEYLGSKYHIGQSKSVHQVMLSDH